LVPDILGSAAVLDKPDAAHLNSRRSPSSADPVKTRLGEIRPSPFSTATSVAFDLARPGHVRLQVYDVLGRLVRTLVTGDQAAGQHRVTWDGLNNAGRRVGTGVYLVLFNAGGVTERRTVVRMN